MGAFFVQAQNGDIYELASTPSVKYSDSGSITDHTVEEGSVLSDHYREKPIQIQFEGTVTSVNQRLTPEIICSSLQAIKKRKETVVVYSVAMFPGTVDCLIENLEFEHSPKRAVSKGYMSAKVSISFRQIRAVSRARFKKEPREKWKDFLNPKSANAAETVKQDKGDSEKDTGWFPKLRKEWEKGPRGSSREKVEAQ